MATTKISITVKDELLAGMDEKRGILSRSTYINLALQEYNKKQELVNHA